MRFSNAVIESIAYALPPEVVTSAAIEERLRPLYERLKLPFGRLEMMTGIRERRFWPEGFRASAASSLAANEVLERTALPREKIGVLMHAAVCRDMLEPATASFVHRQAGLGPGVQVFDVSNACLGFLNGLVILAGMIDSGQIAAGLVVSGENGRPLVEATITRLLDGSLNRNEIKPFFANLTIGAGAVAAVVCHRSLAPRGHRLLGGAALAATGFSELCQGDRAAGDALQMQTDSEQLLVAGVEVARQTWGRFKEALSWTEQTPARFVCHQVGSVHRSKLYETVGLDLKRDFSSFETLGNVGSASLPITLAMAAEAKAIHPGDNVALLGIGSGIHCLMLGLEW